MKNLDFLTLALRAEAWAITPGALDALQRQVEAREPPQADGTVPDLHAAVQRVPIPRNGKQVAIIPFHGVVISRAPAWAQAYGYISPQLFAAELRALADDPMISAVVVWADSPGGTVSGTVEAAEAVAYAKSKKRVVFVAADMICSAAMWIASQASEIVVTPTALTGSIGVITSHMDASGYYKGLGIVVTFIRSAAKKALGQATEPLSEEARAERQALVDAIHGQFVQAVAKGRRKARNVVAEQWATGQVWVGQEAVTAGLADRVASLSTVLAELTGNAAPPEPAPQPQDEDDEDLDAQTTPPITASGDPDPPDAEQTSPTEEPPPEEEAASSIDPTPAPDAQEDPPMNIAAISAKLAAGEKLTAEERTFLNAHLAAEGSEPAADPAPAPAPTAQVDLSALSPEVRALVEQSLARAESAERTANHERDTRLNREFRERALALGQPAAFGATLRAASEKLSKEEYASFEQSLNATGAQLSLLGESGSSRDNRSGGNVQAEYGKRVDAYIKENPTANRAEAGRAVLAADPQFAARYRG